MIRQGQPQDRQALEQLYDICFPGEEGFRRWFFDTMWKPERTLLWQENETIPSAMQLLEGRLVINGTPYPASYVWAAGTHPDFRGRGWMGRLLEQSFVDGVGRGEVFSTLITQNDGLFDFYRPFGYTTIAQVAKRDITPAELPHGYHVRSACPTDEEAILTLYHQETSQVAAMERDGLHFGHMLELYRQRFVVMTDDTNTVKAYAFIEKRGETTVISEAVGESLLAQYLAHVYGCQSYQCPVGKTDTNIVPIGCVKALTLTGIGLLKGLKLPPYLNILLN